MITHIHIYKGNPTSGGLDGIIVSEGDTTNPLVVSTLNIANAEVSQPVKAAIRCNPKLRSVGDVILGLTGLTADKWALALDNSGVPGAFLNWGESLKFVNTIPDTNVIFWIRARVDNTDIPGRDMSASLTIEADIYGA